MTEFSYWWTTSGTPSGDQVASYTQAQLATIAALIAGGSAFEGVIAGYLNEFAISFPGSETARIASGGAVVDGKPYESDADVDINVPAASGAGNTRIDRIVLRADWSAFTVRLQRIAGTDAASPTAPAITQSPGTTYDVTLYQVLVDTAGTVTEQVDERVWAAPEVDDATVEVDQDTGALQVKDGGVDTAQLALAAVTAAKIAAGAVDTSELAADAVTTPKITDENVTAAKIANRTRKLWISAGAMSVIGGTFGNAGGDAKWPAMFLSDASTHSCSGSIALPADWVSGDVTIKAYWSTPSATGDGRFNVQAKSYAAGESIGPAVAADVDVTFTDSIASAFDLQEHTVATNLSVAAGEIMALTFERLGSDGADTISGDVTFLGFLLEYTADS